MADSIKKIVDNYIHEQSRKKKVIITLIILSLFVVTGVFWSLKLNGIALAGDAFCGQEEHAHSEECYEMELICSLEENEEHVHSDECYEKKLICEKEEHTHIDLCYADINADKENKTVWEATLPSLSDDWSKDLVSVAKSQLGYQESEKNFKMAEDGITRKGYSRYGAWYGNEYGDWNGMFVAFCLNHAGISQEIISSKASSQELMNSLQSKELFKIDNCQAGDIIFFDNQRMGIVVEVGDQIQVIEGDSDNKVQKVSYALNDTSIKGYANIQKAEEIAQKESISTLQATIYLDNSYQQESDDNTKITVSGHLPKDAIVKVYPVMASIEKCETIVAYDISIFQENGSLYEVNGQSLTVQVSLSDIQENDKVSVYYIPESSNPEEIEANINENKITFESSHFSTYAIVREANVIEGRGVSDFNALKYQFANYTDTIQLSGNITADSTISLGAGNYTLDLNGFILTAPTNAELFTVPTGATLTIMDSKQNSEAVSNVSGNVYGNVGSYTDTTLTYFVTESNVTDEATGATNETLVKHTVNLSGRISARNATAVKVTGGTVNFESGMLYNGTNRAFNMTSGTLNLKGGYVFGFKKTDAIGTGDTNFGGAILSTGGTINISGTVIAGNEALNGGALYTKGSTKINMTGGIISGNKSTRASNNWSDHSEGAPYRCGGGGFFMDGTTILTMSDGYITNNTASDDDYFDGGGGILCAGTSQIELNGGFITGNEAAGGGGIRSDWNKETKFKMTGGFVTANVARSSEGGGIAVTQGGSGYITKGYITNNKIIKTNHWGGGGVFCSDGSYLYVNNVLVTDNKAGGFGGGVAGCSTGRVYVTVKNGGAIYQNSAEGKNLSGGGSQKNEDHKYAADSPVFMENGYEDYFCALNSLVEGGMLGGGTANWKGSMDGVVVNSHNKEDVLEAAYVMGLTAYPSEQDIQNAQHDAKVFINGNSSYTHGGGILCNGYLIIGEKNPIAVGSRFTLSGTKRLLNENGTDMSLKDYKFKFSVKDENGNVVSIGTSDEFGNINFDRLLSFSEELCKNKITVNGQSADFVYFLSEDAKQEDASIQIDSTLYKITVTVKREDEKLPANDINGDPITKSYYKITGVNVQKSTDEGKSWNNVAYTWTPSRDEQHAGSLKITNDTTFTNRKKKTVSLTVQKKWVGVNDNNLPESVTVDLLRNGEVIDTIILNKENNWSYTWDNLAEGYTYTVKEHPVPGYETSYITGSGTELQPHWKVASKIEVGKNYLVVTPDGYALTGNPNNGGAYDFNNVNFTKVTVNNGVIAIDGITEAMQWNAVSLKGKDGIYLKNLPSSGKHYLSYQNTDTVKASSSTIGYASRAVIENGYLKLYKHDLSTDIKYVSKEGNTLKATSDKANAVRVYELFGNEQENIITITNTKVSNLYDLNVHKVDADDSGISLAGAIFNLIKDGETLTFRVEENKYVYDPDGNITELKSDDNGYIHITGLPEGIYTLKETKAPEGYKIAEETIVQLPGEEEGTVEITVKDQAIRYELPETGGKGTYMLTFIGLLLMVTPFVYKYHSKRKQGKA